MPTPIIWLEVFPRLIARGPHFLFCAYKASQLVVESTSYVGAVRKFILIVKQRWHKK